MNATLWIVQGMLGVAMLVLGVMKSFLSLEKLNKFSWTTRNSKTFIRFVGISELMIGFGLILPQLTGVLPFLTSIAAGALCLIMIFAITEHIRHNEILDISKNVIILILGVFIAVGRY